MQKRFLVTGGVFAFLSVVLGAFAAHALPKYLSPQSVESFNTATRFMFYHALALLALGILADKFASKPFNLSGQLLIIGTVLFSGSIFILSTQSLLGISIPKPLGLITPLGGLFLITGWALFTYSIATFKKTN